MVSGLLLSVDFVIAVSAESASCLCLAQMQLCSLPPKDWCLEVVFERVGFVVYCFDGIST